MPQPPPVVIVPGTPFPPVRNEPLRNGLSARGLDTHLVEFAEETESVEKTRKWLVDWMRERRLEDVALVGYSFGCYRIFDLILHSDVSPRSVVAFAPMAGVPPEARPLLDDVSEMLRAGANLADILAERWYSERHLSKNPGARASLVADFDTMEPSVVLSQFLEYGTAVPLDGQLGEVDVPVYLVSGEEDGTTPMAVARRMETALPQSELEIVPETGHLIFDERSATIGGAADFIVAH